MISSRRATDSSNRSDDDDQSPPPYSRNAVNTTDDTIVDREGETRPLLAGHKEGSSSKSSCLYIPARYVLAIWAFLGFFCLYAMRVNLSVAIVAMVRISLAWER